MLLIGSFNIFSRSSETKSPVVSWSFC